MKKHKNVLSAVIDIHNYSADLYGAEIADHTYSQTCAWRKRMHQHNSKTYSLEQILSQTPRALNSQLKRKRKYKTSPSANHKKRRTSLNH